MESLLRAVGLSGERQRVPAPAPLSTSRARARSAGAARDEGAALLDDALLPDLASIAAATEPGILALEEEARSLERVPLHEALALARRWSLGLQRKPRPDEPLASFKAQFLRSNALERALEGLRRNAPLRGALMDQPLFAVTAGGSGPEEALLVELRAILKLCLPRSAAPLAAPLLRTVLTESPECAAAALTAARALKEDWTEVVRGQSLRGLERRLDSITYELQKSPGAYQVRAKGSGSSRTAALHPGAAGSRRVSYGRVTVLALLCEAFDQSRKRAASRATELSDALRALGLESSAAGALRAEGGGEAAGGNLPSLNDCEAAVAAMVSKKEDGMREGLRRLGLPSGPLHFVPGLELRLCGHDIRVAVNTMIAHWLEEERSAFFESLQWIRRIVDRPAPPLGEEEEELHRQRAVLAQEREALLERLRSLDAQLDEVDGRLAAAAGGTPQAPATLREGTASATASAAAATPWLSLTAVADSGQPPCSLLSTELASLVSSAAEALVGETQRATERLATQLQQRQLQLIAGLTSHLDGEREQFTNWALALSGVGALGVGGAGSAGAAMAIRERLEASLQESRELCGRVEAAAGGEGQARPEDVTLSAGTRCRAKWMDGNFYDATIQSVSSDGTVVLNWLRPRPVGSESPTRRPLITISEAGGDDTLHRMVMKADIQLQAEDTGDRSNASTATSFFQARSAEDRTCADCDGMMGVEWASVSFGIFLCRACVEVHQRLGPRVSLVRQLNDGWGWPQRDIRYLDVGGNAAFLACLAQYPEIRAAPTAERYSSRFAEYYRRHLDAICTGAPLPHPPPRESAGQTGTAEFLSSAEAVAVVQEVGRQFETAMHQAAAQSRLAAAPRPMVAPSTAPDASSRVPAMAQEARPRAPPPWGPKTGGRSRAMKVIAC